MFQFHIRDQTISRKSSKVDWNFAKHVKSNRGNLHFLSTEAFICTDLFFNKSIITEDVEEAVGTTQYSTQIFTRFSTDVLICSFLLLSETGIVQLESSLLMKLLVVNAANRF